MFLFCFFIIITDIVKLLLSHNASARSKNSYGWTPLNESVSYGNRIISMSTSNNNNNNNNNNSNNIACIVYV